MKIFKRLFTIKIKKAVILIGAFLLLYFVYTICITSNITIFSTQKSIPNIMFRNGEQSSFHNHLNVTKICKPSGINMIYNNTCPFQIDVLPKTDIQMLNVIKKLDFHEVYEQRQQPKKWNEQHKLKVFVVPHSHNDPGWIKTFEEYYHSKTKYILYGMIAKLPENPKRKFIWAEISFFSMWWNDLGQNDREAVKKLILNKQLEFVTGGWVMNDEASTHWISTMYQITEGHKWLKLHLNYTPKSHWSIDPFGLGATQPLLLKQMGLENMLIQRVHYVVKKHFGTTRNLEFRWKQLWDNTGETEMFTQLMPYSSYSISRSCGPSSNICNKFDFKSLSWSWPWRWLYKDVLPQPITSTNVQQRAGWLLDQLRKKSMLFKTDVLLVPLGDDFTYSKPEEFDVQFQNYEKLFNFMNAKPKMHIEIQFGTLSDYFDAVHSDKSTDHFPTLTGDFFTYSQRYYVYWSGYYTSRPFYKRMDRELLSYTRAAEIILTLAHLNRKPGFKLTAINEARLLGLLTDARRALALFQHHDAITGTSRKHVVEDYGKKMLEAIEKTKDIIQHCTNLLLLVPWADIGQTDTVRYNVDDIRHSHSSLAEQHVISVTPAISKKIVLFNSLPYGRHEIVSIMVDTPFVEITDLSGININCQVSPVFEYKSTISDSKYAVSFVAEVSALGLIVYTINALEDKFAPFTVHSSLSIFNQHGDVEIPNAFQKIRVSAKAEEFKIKNDHITAVFSDLGLLKTLNVSGYTAVVKLDFAAYGPGCASEKSGAYLFLPGGEAIPIEIVNTTVKVIEGPLMSSVIVQLPYIQHTVTLFNTQGADSLGLEIENIIDISQTSNFEIVMRLSTNINNGNVFFTDLNGYQVIRRELLHKLPFSANYYPMSTMAYIEDETTRLTILTGTPLGCTSLREGQVEIMLDRRLEEDDQLGLGQGVMDNHPTKHIFKVILERKTQKCKAATDDHPAGFPSLSAHAASQSLLNPLIRILKIGADALDVLDLYSPATMEFGLDFTLASLRNDVIVDHKYYIGIVLLRQYLDICFADKTLLRRFPLSLGSVNISGVLPELEEDIGFNKASLSFLNIYEGLDFRNDIVMCPMAFQAFVLYK